MSHDNPAFVDKEGEFTQTKASPDPELGDAATPRDHVGADAPQLWHNGKQPMHDHPVTAEILVQQAPSAPSASTDIMYGIDDTPPWYLCLLLGLQHYLTMLGATVAIPYILCPKLCMEDDDPAKAYIIATLLFISGLVTFLQTTIGVRLPIVQGGTFSFFAPTFAILSLPRNQCPADFAETGWGPDLSYEEKTEEWQRRMREVQGAIIVASLFQFVAGYFGIIGAVLRFITPLTIAPAVAMIGLALFDVAAEHAVSDWRVSFATVIFMILFSQYLREVNVPVLTCRGNKGCGTSNVPIFKLFPVLMSILVMWTICGICTAVDYFPEGHPARTDVKSDLINDAAWVRVPYPFQWGFPTVTVAGVIGMLAGVLASAIESVGDYYACARLAGAPPPPPHAVNRGIGTEGLGCILAGIFGTGNGTTSYSENIGAIGVTKVGSRRVIQYTALLLVLCGLFSKGAAVFVTIPEPIIGGIFVVMFGMVAAVGLSTTQFVNLNSSRNLFILGFSIFNGLMIGQWVGDHRDAVSTGVELLDQLITVLLSTSMFVSGFLGFLLDNTVPGSDDERGLTAWRSQHEAMVQEVDTQRSPRHSPYDPPFIMDWLRRRSWSKYVPSLPTYEEGSIRRLFCRTNKVCCK